VRVTADDVRVTAGDVRVTARDVRVTADDVRVTARDVRVTADDVRVTADDVRVTAGDVRVTAGDVRVTAGDVQVSFARRWLLEIIFCAACYGTPFDGEKTIVRRPLGASTRLDSRTEAFFAGIELLLFLPQGSEVCAPRQH
jgi:hypothetical protein